MSQLGGPLPEVDEDEEKKELFSRPFDYLDEHHPWVGKATNATIKFLQNISDDPASEWNRERYAKIFEEEPQKIEQINEALDKGEHDPLGQIFGQGIEIARHIPTVAGFQPIDRRAAITALIATPIARRVKPKHLGITQSISKIKTLPEPTVARSLINVTEGQSIFSTPKVTGIPKPKGLLRKYQNPKGGEVYDPNVFISKAEMSAMLNTMTVDGAEGYGLFSVKPAADAGAIGDLLKRTSSTGLTVSKENIAPGFQATQSEITEVIKIHEEFKDLTKSGKRLGEKETSIGSTIGSMGQKKSFNLSPIEKAQTVDRAVGGTIIKEIPGKRGIRREITAEIENTPYKELHHIFGKAPGEKIISNVWKLINEGKATVEDLINLNYWAKSYGMGLGDYGAEAVNRVPHSRTHSRSRAFGREMSSKEIQAIPEFDNIDDLTSYFRETIETRVIQMRGELDIQQGIYNELPKKTRIEVEQLKVAKEKASRNLTDRYKKIYGETMRDTPPEVKDAYQTHIWIQKDLNVTDSKLIKLAEKLDQARKIQDDQMARVVKQLEQLETEELSSLDRRAIKTGRPGKETSPRAQEKIDYSQVRDETDTYEMLTGKEQFW